MAMREWHRRRSNGASPLATCSSLGKRRWLARLPSFTAVSRKYSRTVAVGVSVSGCTGTGTALPEPSLDRKSYGRYRIWYGVQPYLVNREGGQCLSVRGLGHIGSHAESRP